MPQFDPNELFWALSHAIKNNIPDGDAGYIRASVFEYLGYPEIRLKDKVLLDCLRRRLDRSPIDIPPERKEEIILEFFGENEDMFKI